MNTAQEGYLETAINKTTRENKTWEFDVNHVPALARATAPQHRGQGHGCRTACGPSVLSMGLSLRPEQPVFHSHCQEENLAVSRRDSMRQPETRRGVREGGSD